MSKAIPSASVPEPFSAPLRILCVNDAPPPDNGASNQSPTSAPGASATRIAALAGALAARGHQVVLLTPTHGTQAGDSLASIPSRIAAQDWATPLHLQLARQGHFLHSLHRAEKTPALLRNLITRWQLKVEGGLQSDWSHAARAAQSAILDGFKPQIIWAGFGGFSNLRVAQQFAHEADIPWVIDFDAHLDHPVPQVLRTMMQQRVADACAVTGDAQVHAALAAQWFPQPYHLIRSDAAPAMRTAIDRQARQDRFLVTLIGAAKSETDLSQFIKGLSRWLAKGDARRRATTLFHYSGPDHHDVRAAVAHIGLDCVASIEAELPLNRLAKLCQDAAINGYINAADRMHPHALNLIAARRPQVCVPAAHREVIALARDMGGGVRNCAHADGVVAALDSIWAARTRNHAGKGPRAARLDLSPIHWDTGAAQLEAVLARYVAGRSTNSVSKPEIRAR